MTPPATSIERSAHGGLSHLAALEAESIFIMLGAFAGALVGAAIGRRSSRSAVHAGARDATGV